MKYSAETYALAALLVIFILLGDIFWALGCAAGVIICVLIDRRSTGKW